MNEKIIGFVYRFDNNDYEIALSNFSQEDQDTLMGIFTKYADLENTTCERGDKNLSLKDCNVDWWENGKAWQSQDYKKIINKLAFRYSKIEKLEEELKSSSYENKARIHEELDELYKERNELTDELKKTLGA